MPQLTGVDPVDADERIYRRIPVSMGWYTPEQGVLEDAFSPTKRDETGISFTRAKYVSSAADAARGPSKSGYYVAVLNAGRIQQFGLTIVPKPTAEDIGHCEIKEIRRETRGTPECDAAQYNLARYFVERVEGPFRPDSGAE